MPISVFDIMGAGQAEFPLRLAGVNVGRQLSLGQTRGSAEMLEPSNPRGWWGPAEHLVARYRLFYQSQRGRAATTRSEFDCAR